MKNVMFQKAPIPGQTRGSFDLSHESKITTQIGWLTPFLWYDCVPGDNFEISTELLVKMAPLVYPVMHEINVYTHFFFVPYRILMYEDPVGGNPSWQQFITGDPESYYAAGAGPPYCTLNDTTKTRFTPVSVAGYFGLPWVSAVGTVTQDVDLNMLPIHGYHAIYNNYYRDENLIDPVCEKSVRDTSGGIPLIGGDRTADYADLLPLYPYKRSWEKDYFRGALPTAYTGASSDVEMDLDVTGGGVGSEILWADTTDGGAPAGGDPTITTGQRYFREAGPGNEITLREVAQSGIVPTLEAMELRRMLAVTKWLEAERRGGTRYDEMLLGIWGVKSDNAELQEPQYIGGGKQHVTVSAVVNQSAVYDSVDALVDYQGQESGKAMAYGNHKAKKYCKEHGIIIGILSSLPRTSYGGAQIERFWRKMDREDWFVPQLQNIGDQSILQSEIHYDATGVDMDNVFGYTVPWAEYKFKNSFAGGAFAAEFDFMHMSYIGDSAGAGPDLNRAFIECDYTDDEIDRIFAETGGVQLYCRMQNNVYASRPILVHDIPK